MKIALLAPYRHPRGGKAGPNDPENVTFLDEKNFKRLLSLYGPPGENFSPFEAKTPKIALLAPYRPPRSS